MGPGRSVFATLLLEVQKAQACEVCGWLVATEPVFHLGQPQTYCHTIRGSGLRRRGPRRYSSTRSFPRAFHIPLVEYVCLDLCLKAASSGYGIFQMQLVPKKIENGSVIPIVIRK